MPEFWELCDNKSLAVLIQLYWEENGCYPPWYYILSGEEQRPLVTVDPDVEEDHLKETRRFMSQPPRAEGHGGY